MFRSSIPIAVWIQWLIILGLCGYSLFQVKFSCFMSPFMLKRIRASTFQCRQSPFIDVFAFCCKDFNTANRPRRNSNLHDALTFAWFNEYSLVLATFQRRSCSQILLKEMLHFSKIKIDDSNETSSFVSTTPRPFFPSNPLTHSHSLFPGVLLA